MVRMSVILASCVLTASAYAATMYKWVDERGVTHYGEKPPPGQKAQELKIRTTPSAPPVVDAKDKDPSAGGWQEQERAFRQRQAERADKERETEKKARAEAQRMKVACIAARNDLEILGKDRPVYELDEKGQRKYIDDKTRAAGIAQAKKEIAMYCKS